MPISYTIKATRPSLNHNFYMELDNEPGTLGAFSSSTESPNILSKAYDEFITWADLWARKDELRPDLKSWLEESYSELAADPELYGTGPEFNPLSLTHTVTYKFNSTSDVEIVGDSDIRDLWQEYIKKSENTIEETLIDADGAPLTDLLNKYKFS